MKPTIAFGCFVGLILVSAATSALAQRPVPEGFDFKEFVDFEIPPIPPIPPLPPLPAFEWQRGTGTSDPELGLQQEAFRALLRNSPDRALELATERLKTDPADALVLSNLSAIANSGYSKALPLLISIAKTSTNPVARREAVLAISRGRNDKEVLATLEDLYRSSSDNVDVRRSVVTSIGRSADPRAVVLLADIVKNDADQSIRRTAIQQLGNRKEPEALKALEDVLKESAKTRG